MNAAPLTPKHIANLVLENFHYLKIPSDQNPALHNSPYSRNSNCVFSFFADKPLTKKLEIIANTFVNGIKEIKNTPGYPQEDPTETLSLQGPYEIFNKIYVLASHALNQVITARKGNLHKASEYEGGKFEENMRSALTAVIKLIPTIVNDSDTPFFFIYPIAANDQRFREKTKQRKEVIISLLEKFILLKCKTFGPYCQQEPTR